VNRENLPVYKQHFFFIIIDKTVKIVWAYGNMRLSV